MIEAFIGKIDDSVTLIMHRLGNSSQFGVRFLGIKNLIKKRTLDVGDIHKKGSSD
jgi:hypothetical protein